MHAPPSAHLPDQVILVAIQRQLLGLVGLAALDGGLGLVGLALGILELDVDAAGGAGNKSEDRLLQRCREGNGEW